MGFVSFCFEQFFLDRSVAILMMLTIDVCLVLNCFLFEMFYLHYALCDFDSIWLHCTKQRWSRGHKARGQGQGHKKKQRPRPRTAFPRTDPLEAKDWNARGQGQGPRTQPQVFSKKKKKKVCKKVFQAFSNL